MPALAPDRTEIPATIALPPTGPNGAGSAVASGIYRALLGIDPALLPPEAISIAETSHRFEAMAPKLGRNVTGEIARWRAEVSRAAAAGDPLPSYDELVKAIVSESAARKLTTMFRAEWGFAIRGVTDVLTAHADDIILKLRPLHDQAWSDFQAHAGQLAAFETESQLLGNAAATDSYHLAGSALSRFGAVRAARHRLDELPKYSVTNAEQNLVLFRNPEPMRGKTLPKHTLPRWAAIRELYLEADPWMPLKSEVEALRDQRARARQEARYA